ncbi:MAG: hypothetical protein ACLR4Z_11305 [Butyricicoccaceae bacterium]
MELARLKKPENVLHAFSESREQAEKDTESARSRLFAARRAYAERFAPCPFRTEALDNDEFDAERRALEESELLRYRRKIRAARESAMEQFQNDFLSRLKSSIEQVQAQVRNLNRALRAGTVRHGQLSVPRRPQPGLRGLLRHDHGARADGGRYYAVLRAVPGEIRPADRQAVQPDHDGGRYAAERPQAERAAGKHRAPHGFPHLSEI